MDAKNPLDDSTPQQSDNPYPRSVRVQTEIDIAGQIVDEPAAGVTRQPALPEKRKLYLPVKGKFFISTAFACVWSSFSCFLAQHWLAELAQVVGDMPAAMIVFFIALLPGFLNAHILASVILERPPKLQTDIKFPAISLLLSL